ncbi:MAG: redox-regulated ATPase YchF [Anaerolineae bacterium]|nr:redox-regulated ATPase YchF [Anaerolineae bacterium]
MRLGIIGLPNSSKTTIFNALTGLNRPTGAVSSGQIEVFNAVVNVPDERVDKLSAMYEPKKTTYAAVTFSDIAGIDKGFGESGLSGQLKNELAQVDGFVHVVRAFDDDAVPHPYVTIDPKRDVEMVDTEFILSDLIMIEKKIERLQSDLNRTSKGGRDKLEQELALMERLKTALEAETPLRDIELDTEEEKSLRGFGFLSQKPLLLVFNTGDQLRPASEILTYNHKNTQTLSLQGKIEAEIAQLGKEDREIFLQEYGIADPIARRAIRAAYELMHLQSFFTVGKDEVRAWSVQIGASAPEAAGVIHSDLQKGFIRAEVMTYDVLMELGSEHAVKEAGKLRLEGKTYIVQDGDILHIRHSG